MTFVFLTAITRTGILGCFTMQTNDCENAATVCNTGAEINMEMRNAVCLCFSFRAKSLFALLVCS